MKYAAGFALFALLALITSRAAEPDPAEQELINLENAWATAIVRRDGEFLQQLYADEYIYTGSNASVADKKTDIADIVSGKTQLDSFRLARMRVRVYGDVAVVRGLNMLKGSYDGKSVSGPYRFTDVFHRRDGRWQVVASHVTLAAKI